MEVMTVTPYVQIPEIVTRVAVCQVSNYRLMVLHVQVNILFFHKYICSRLSFDIYDILDIFIIYNDIFLMYSLAIMAYS